MKEMAVFGDTMDLVNTEKRVRQSFDEGWRFCHGDVKGAERPEFDDTNWRELNLPHDWSIEGSFDANNPTGGDGGYLPAGIGWYRKTFAVPEEYEGKLVSIEFDGVYMNSDVWINGNHLGRHPYGYTGFRYDTGPFLNFGGQPNIIAVRVDNSSQPNSRWYTGSGIYRHTWLLKTEKLCVVPMGVYVTTPRITGEAAEIRISTRISGGGESVVVRSAVFDPEMRIAGRMESTCGGSAEEEYENLQVLKVENPVLWSPENPALYRLITEVISGGQVVDSLQTAFGIREIRFDKDEGFVLNGIRTKINGVCLHHDGGCVGAAVPERVLERRLELLKQMGCNGIRMSHNPPAPELLDLCDRMGFLVMDEAFDEWRIGKNKNNVNFYGYFQYFDDNCEKDLISMLRRDRNHPCVVLWSVGNEIPEQSVEGEEEILKRLVEICHREDPTRPVTLACDQIAAEPAEAREKFLELLDVVGYNYVNRWRTRTETYYAEDRHKYPHRKIIGSENISAGGVKNDYSMVNRTGSWWWRPYNSRLIQVEQLWKFTRMHDYVAGDFMWTGIDYLGEARWPHKNSSSGVIDTCGFLKDGYYFYQSQWTQKPMLHIFPHWNWKGREGEVIPVLCFTNCDSVELFLNGKSYGRKSYEFPCRGMTKEYGHFDKPPAYITTSDLHLSWDVPYEPGTLLAVGMKDGVRVCEETVVTASDPATVELVADRSEIFADGRDVCHLTVRILDAAGNLVPTAENTVYFEVEGAGSLIGVDNGRPDSHEGYKESFRKAWTGMCLALVQAGKTPGRIRVSAKADGLEPGNIAITTIPRNR